MDVSSSAVLVSYLSVTSACNSKFTSSKSELHETLGCFTAPLSVYTPCARVQRLASQIFFVRMVHCLVSLHIDAENRQGERVGHQRCMSVLVDIIRVRTIR